MGGSLTVGIRLLDGTEYISERWTNPLPNWLANPLFWTGQKVVREYIDSGKDNFEPSDRVFPSSYGLTLIDYQTKRAFSRNGYSGVGHLCCGFLDHEDAKNLLDIIKRGWVTRYQVLRHSPVGGVSEEQRRALLEDDTLHPDEIPVFHELLEKILSGPDPKNSAGWTAHTVFSAGMVILHWQMPGWTVDNGDNEPNTAWWPEALKFLKETGWKSGAWTQEEVDAKYGDEDEVVASP